ncbi:MAG: hypothetical protein O7H39_06735, partial [Gammaproteobacteria bacterium]|nr:hypothetical protein [Gammaproteobacteria bacterium]
MDTANGCELNARMAITGVQREEFDSSGYLIVPLDLDHAFLDRVISELAPHYPTPEAAELPPGTRIPDAW